MEPFYIYEIANYYEKDKYTNIPTVIEENGVKKYVGTELVRQIIEEKRGVTHKRIQN